jgi:hypothetical protein
MLEALHARNAAATPAALKRLQQIAVQMATSSPN